MNRASPLLWIIIFFLLLVPTAAGRFLLDLAGGLMILLISIPFIITGIGWISWKIIKSKLTQCSNCGSSFPNNLLQCPICGSNTAENNFSSDSSETINNSIPASSATIDIKAEESN